MSYSKDHFDLKDISYLEDLRYLKDMIFFKDHSNSKYQIYLEDLDAELKSPKVKRFTWKQNKADNHHTVI